MNDLTIHGGNADTMTMTSREIAELTGKEHKNVCRDIRNMLEALKKDRLSFEHIYKDAYGREQEEYRLDRELTLTLVSGYDIPLRHRVVTRLAELEAQGAKPALNPANLSRLQLIEMAMQAEQERLVLENKVGELAPKADALDRLATATEGAVGLRIAAKLMQMPEKQFLQFANAEGFIFRNHFSGIWQGYADKAKAGLVELKFTKVERNDGTEKTVEQVLITRAGLAKLAAIQERRTKCTSIHQETQKMPPPSTRSALPPSSSLGL